MSQGKGARQVQSERRKKFFGKAEKRLDKLQNLWYNIITKRVATKSAKRMKRRKENTMTIREYYQSVLDANISDEMNKATQTLIEKLDARNEKRKSSDSKEKQAVRARYEVVAKFLDENKGNEFTRDAIAEACNISVGQAQSAALALVRGGIAKKSEVKVDKTKRVVYSIAE